MNEVVKFDVVRGQFQCPPVVHPSVLVLVAMVVLLSAVWLGIILAIRLL